MTSQSDESESNGDGTDIPLLFSPCLSSPCPYLQDFGGRVVLPDFDAISRHIGTDGIIEFRCPPDVGQASGGSILDAVIVGSVQAFVNGHDEAMMNMGGMSRDQNCNRRKVLDLAGKLATSKVPILNFKEPSWADRRSGLWFSIQLACSVDWSELLVNMDSKDDPYYFQHKVVKVAMVDGWPPDRIETLRRLGATSRLAIVESRDALISMREGGRNPLDVDFDNNEDWFDEDDCIENIGDRLTSAMAWYHSEKKYSNSIKRIVSKSTSNGISFPAVVTDLIDALLFGPPVDL